MSNQENDRYYEQQREREYDLVFRLRALLNSLEGLNIEGKTGNYLQFDIARENAKEALLKAEVQS